MDTGDSTDWVSISHNLYVNYVLQAVPLVILYYDYLLTLGDEIENYWPPRRPLTWLSGLFLGTRYLTLLGFVPIVVTMVWGTETAVRKCGPVQLYHSFLEILLQIPVGLLCLLRVYALYSKDRRILWGLTLSGLILLAIAIYFVTTLNGHAPAYFWSSAPLCGNSRTADDGIRFAACWSAVLVFDFLVFLLTAVRAFRVWQSGVIVRVVLRDGVLYFCALAASNLLNIIVLVAATPLLKTTFASLTNVLSVTLISRLMLNLRSDTTEDVLTEDTELSGTQPANLDTYIVVPESHIGTRRSMA
ncbi:hypothetical protein PENSPDRAFT_284329 [Peniophora sp. CONT]|nr:hypothetical protein PENSPDRAFT_284329 [Peniophora sp. CONT]